MVSNNFIAFLTLARREVLRVLRIWPQTILPSCVTTTLYFVIFGNIIGSKLSAVDGFSYMTFIVPGLVMMAVITNAYMNVSFSFFIAKFQRFIEELLVAPITPGFILLGYIAGSLVRSLLVGGLIVVISLFFTKLQIYNWPLMLATVILSTILFSLAGFVNAIFANNFDDINIVPTFVLTPLTYLGGVFYSIKMLPPVWQIASYFNPIFYIINAFRYTLLGVSDLNFIWSFGFLVVSTVVLFIVVLRLLQRGVGVRN